MSNEVAKPEDFTSRMFSRIRESMGDLMTDDELKKLVERATNEAFFTQVRIPKQYGQDEMRPPHFVTLVESLLRDEVRKHVEQWMAEHPTEVKATIEKVVQAGVAGAVMEAVNRWASSPMMALQGALINQGIKTHL